MFVQWYRKNRKFLKRGVKIALYGSFLIFIVVFFEHFFKFPLLTAVLGPTAYVFAAHPQSETARIRNATIGHSCAVLVGVSTLAVFGFVNNHTSLSSLSFSWYQVLTVTVALFLTLFLLEVLKSHHAPAAGTVILISSGLASYGLHLIGLVVGLASIILMAAILNHFLPNYKGSHHGGDSPKVNQRHW